MTKLDKKLKAPISIISISTVIGINIICIYIIMCIFNICRNLIFQLLIGTTKRTRTNFFRT